MCIAVMERNVLEFFAHPPLADHASREPCRLTKIVHRSGGNGTEKGLLLCFLQLSLGVNHTVAAGFIPGDMDET